MVLYSCADQTWLKSWQFAPLYSVLLSYTVLIIHLSYDTLCPNLVHVNSQQFKKDSTGIIVLIRKHDSAPHTTHLMLCLCLGVDK